ncbi:hypothetical protein [Vulgatibacter incomptus]|uniref:Lipoprotein n=1 Tax=Vulgatibacter incomptus TaxID=1391653 RepID=A0A0K1PBD0_9BACT|nr:hypothetical protein [Vulgatibacter incomptus]AKU90434.1 hypothetical protein AKJ08_0821 [Vulgatibacter incomptus]
MRLHKLLSLLFAALASLAGAALLQACEGLACNDILPFEGLAAHLDLPEGVELTSAEGHAVVDGKTYEFHCETPDRGAYDGVCGLYDSVVSIRLDASKRPSTIDLSLSINGGAFTFEGPARPTYEVSEPWGKGCGHAMAGDAAIKLTPGE